MIKLAICNVFRKKEESVLTFLIMGIAVFAIVLLSGTYHQISSGIALVRDRIGADVIILPRSDNSDIEYTTALYTAEPSDEYIAISDVTFLNNDNRIVKKTFQFFTHTIEAGCCTTTDEARVVGFDQSTDFVIKPWLEKQNFDSLCDDEVIIGGAITSIIGQQMSILGRKYKIVGILYDTGSGLDQSIFMNISEARRLAEENFLQEDTQNKISSILLKLDKTVNVSDYIKNFNRSNPNLIAISKNESLDYVENQLYGWGEIVWLLIVSLVLILLFSLFGRYSAIVYNKKGEYGYLRTTGVKRLEIFSSILFEITLLSFICGITFGIMALVCMDPLLNRIREFFVFPISDLIIGDYIKLLIIGIGFAELVSFFSCIYPVWKVLQHDPQEALSTNYK